MTTASRRRLLAGPAVLLTTAVLVVPVVAGALDSTLMTPLALPGYLLLTVGSAVGNLLFPNLALWVYWVPFAVASYVLAVGVGVGYRSLG